MEITAIELSKKNKGVRRIFLDDSFAFSMPEEAFLRLNLYEKETLTAQEVADIRETTLRQTAKEHAVRFLSVRDRTEKGLVERLVRAGYDEDVAIVAAQDMKTVGYIDDHRYAQRYIDEQLRTKAVSKKSMQYALQQRGIDKETVEGVIAEVDQDDEEVAMRGAKKKFGKYDLDDAAIERKAYAYLLHRGFSYDVARKVLNQMKK